MVSLHAFVSISPSSTDPFHHTSLVTPSHSDHPDETALALYYRLHPISLQANPGVVVASIIVSLLGSYATLTLLGRRTGMHGWRNHVILGLSVVCFATVAVWGMHFVGFHLY
jgi:hypothetical protein